MFLSLTHSNTFKYYSASAAIILIYMFLRVHKLYVQKNQNVSYILQSFIENALGENFFPF